ncbi:unnamed protein product [Allacma fusca]|uniref:Uncharacterized protein n=1 Tax=Allacma fusca TaxID=39272 RepID=A0A8J2L4A3_9HEXA|nr:unnamed protein product [Allacma fusca]
MERNHKLALLALSSFFLLIGSSDSYKVRLEGKADVGTGAWKQISCRQIGDYKEYIAGTGCNVSPYPLDEEFFKTIVQESWGVCSRPTCDFIYYDGSLPKPQTVTVKAFIGGKATILISSKRSLLTPDFAPEKTLEATQPERPEFETWKEYTITISPSNYVIGLTLSSPDDKSVVLVDYIELDFGDDVTAPPTPTTTTPAPPQTLFEVDKVSDLSKEFTEVSCNYVEHIEELWVWGCPRDVTQEENTIGYWAPCKIPSCYFIFTVDQDSTPVSEVTLHGIFNRGAQISISKKSSGLGATSREIYRREMIQDQRSLTFQLGDECDNGKFNISINGAKGLAMIDRLTVSLLDDLESPCAPGDPEDTTDAGDDDGEGPATGDPDGSASIVSSITLCALALAIASGLLSLH